MRQRTPDQNVKLLDAAMVLIDLVRDDIAQTPVPPTDAIFVPAGSSLQTAIDQAPDGATLQLDAATFAQGMFTVSKRLTITRGGELAPGRATADAPCWIRGNDYAAITVTGSLTLRGVGVKNDRADGDLIDECGTNSTYDRITGLGDPTNGQRRGILLHGTTTKVVQAYFDHIRLPGRDTCVLGGYNGGDGITIDDCYLCGGAETIMFGGGDSNSADKNPRNITITNSILTKRPEWYSQGAQLKNAFELKNASHVVMTNCQLEYAGVSEGQAAYLIVLTVRNQDGNTPWSAITDVRIENCACRYGGGGISFLGHDDNYESGNLDGCVIKNVSFSEMNPQGLWSQGGYSGSGRCAMFSNTPRNVTMDAITMHGTNMSSLGYFANAPKQPVGLVLRNWKYCATEYGWKIDDGGMDMPPACSAITQLMPDLVYEVTDHDPGASLTRRH